MSWKSFVRELERDAKRRAREQERFDAQQEKERQRALKAAIKEREKEAVLRDAQDQADRFAAYLEHLVALHKRCSPGFDWAAALTSAPPEAPEPIRTREDAARRALDGFAPSALQKLTGSAKKQRAELEEAVTEARFADERENVQRASEHEHALANFSELQGLARGVLELDPESLETAIGRIRLLVDLEALGLDIHIVEVEKDAVSIQCVLMDDEVVPTDDVGLTAAGKLSKKKMAKSKYWDIYQDFVCSCVLRIALETFALLPISRVVVNVVRETLNTSTGHMESNVLIGAHIPRAVLSTLNLAAVDPSDSMANFGHRMEFKKTTGFKSVEAVHLAEKWATT